MISLIHAIGFTSKLSQAWYQLSTSLKCRKTQTIRQLTLSMHNYLVGVTGSLCHGIEIQLICFRIVLESAEKATKSE